MSEKDGAESSAAAASSTTTTLSESAAKYCQAQQAPKRKFEEVEVVTGEEGEKNVLQVRIFSFMVYSRNSQ